MAKSYKNDVLRILNAQSKEEIITVNGIDIPLYTVNKQALLSKVDLGKIIKEEGLKGKNKPVAIIQYATYIPWIDDIGPMLVFVWSWGDPWCFIYNIQFPEYSESGALPIYRVAETAGWVLPDVYFNRKI